MASVETNSATLRRFNDCQKRFWGSETAAAVLAAWLMTEAYNMGNPAAPELRGPYERAAANIVFW